MSEVEKQVSRLEKNHNALVIACRWMRAAQRDFFADPSRVNQWNAEQAEREVDRLCYELRQDYMPMEVRNLVYVASDCRRQQRAYFADRNKQSIDEAKLYEMKLDSVLAGIGRQERIPLGSKTDQAEGAA